MKRNVLSACCVVVILSGILSPLHLHAQTFSENQIKGALLYKLTNYIRWENGGKQPNLCFIGDDEDQAGEIVSKTVSFLAEKEKGKFKITPSVNVKSIKSCNMLFIGAGWKSNLHDILAVLDDQQIVTISDIDSFTKRGGMFGFYDKNGTLSIELNFANAKAKHININAALREIINIVE